MAMLKKDLVIKEEAGTRVDKVVTTAVATGATTTLAVVISRVTAVARCATTSTRAAGQHLTVLIQVPVADSPETRDGYLPSVDKVRFFQSVNRTV